MSINIAALQALLCTTLCKDVRVTLTEGKAAIALPVSGRDGDETVAYVSPTIWGLANLGYGHKHDEAQLRE